MGADGLSERGIGAEEFFGPHDIAAARAVASEYGSHILAMIPGSHVAKTYLFDREYESGRKPISYQGRSGTTAR
tara:strand:+ start:2749 stop:2970 length:222 start_codon:yes stop_codon:yes gene_type:complete